MERMPPGQEDAAMRTTTRPRRLRAAAAACASVLLAALVAAAPAGAEDGGGATPPRRYYLSLGDSMGFGLQFDKFDQLAASGAYSPDRFDTGYTDVLAARMQPLRPRQQTVNLSCPGESAVTMVDGGCVWTSPAPDGMGLPLHTQYAGSQLDAAVAFLRAHPGKVSPVTVSVGGIDVADVIADECGADRACLEQSGIRGRLGAGLDRILGALRAAAPDTEV